MFTHSLTRRSRAALLTIVSAASIAGPLGIGPATAHADPRPTHASVEPTTPDRDDELLDACPVAGHATYEDSWGWARSGGRRHQGVDMIAERGTPVVAVRDGDARFKHNRLGGKAVWLTAPNGDKFYYAHLDRFEGESRSVEAGEVIGYVGSTGNAHGPHLHFETLPGGRNVNPYAHTVGACVPTPEELAAIEAHAANRLNDPKVWARFVPQQ